MIKTGLVSISFRKLSPQQIVEMVQEAGLCGIEWGGDIHVPHGDTRQAALVREMTYKAGLETAAYGSYYYVGEEHGFTFQDVLNTAVQLEAPVIRVWAGKRGSGKANSEYRKRVVEESVKIAEMAKREGIKVAYEFHGNTLTDTNESALNLLKEVDHENMKSYWQPPAGYDMEKRLEGLEMIMPWLENVHVFYWLGEKRCPLEEGIKEWEVYFKSISQKKKDICYAMIEFVKGDTKEQFLEDAKVLKKLSGF